MLARDETQWISCMPTLGMASIRYLFSTHITADLERAADFITYITDGRLYYTGPKDEFEGIVPPD